MQEGFIAAFDRVLLLRENKIAISLLADGRKIEIK